MGRGIQMGQPPGGRKQTIQPTKMGRDTNTPTEIASQAKWRTTSRDHGRFTSAAATRSTREIPGIIGPAIDRIVRFMVHEQLRDIGRAQDDRTSLAQSPDQRPFFMHEVLPLAYDPDRG